MFPTNRDVVEPASLDRTRRKRCRVPNSPTCTLEVAIAFAGEAATLAVPEVERDVTLNIEAISAAHVPIEFCFIVEAWLEHLLDLAGTATSRLTVLPILYADSVELNLILRMTSPSLSHTPDRPMRCTDMEQLWWLGGRFSVDYGYPETRVHLHLPRVTGTTRERRRAHPGWLVN